MPKVLRHYKRASSKPYKIPEPSVPCQREESTQPPGKVTLHIFFNCQTTGPGRPFVNKITQIAAVSEKPGEPFHQHIRIGINDINSMIVYFIS